MFTRIFWEKTAERFVRGFATAFILTTSGLELVSSGQQFGLKERALAGLLQGVGAVALSLIGGTIGDQTSPSLLPPREVTQERDSKGRFKGGDGGHVDSSGLVVGLVAGVILVVLFLALAGRL